MRILGDITPEKVELLQKADRIFIEELHNFGIYNDVWQAFAVLLPIQSVGVMGDFRTYEKTVALRAVTSTDGMTADWARLPHDFLASVSSRITSRGPRRQPRRLRHLVKTAEHDRVGIETHPIFYVFTRSRVFGIIFAVRRP